MGGSGICARPVDMLKIIYLISKDGVYNDKQLIPADYIKAARMKQSDPYGKSGTLEEMQGYGYQIWITRNGGYASMVWRDSLRFMFLIRTSIW